MLTKLSYAIFTTSILSFFYKEVIWLTATLSLLLLFKIRKTSVQKAIALDSSKKINILVVDDDNVTIKLIKNLLKKIYAENVHVEVASNASDCLSKLQTYSPDVIILDMMMPGSKGDTVVGVMNKFHRENISKTIVSTSLEESTDMVQMALNSGCQYMQKPISLSKLRGAIDSIEENR